MKSIIRFSLLCIALICFSNMGISQKKNKKKAKTSIGTKKTIKKSSTSKKKNKKKTKSTKKRTTNYSKTIKPVKQDQIIVFNELPSKINIVDTTPEKIVTIVSAFKPQLKNIAKIGFNNATAIVDTNTVTLAYKVPSQNLSFQYQPISLIPRAIKRDSLVTNKQVLSFKIGVGNYMNQYIQAQTSLIDSKNQNHSFNITNESIAGDHPLQKWNSLNFNYLNSLNLNQNKQINSQIIFNQSNRYRYGLVPDTTKLPSSNFEQKFTIVGARFSLSNRINKMNFVDLLPILEFNHENLFNQAKNLSINFTTPITFNFKNKLVLHNDFRFSFNQYNLTSKTSTQNYFVQLDPSVNLKIKQFQLNMGVRPTILNGEFALYPKIELEKQLKDTNIIFHAGWKTTVSNNQLTPLMSQNHWIKAPEDLPISTNESKYFQVDFTVNKQLNYGFKMAMNDYRELAFFNQTKSINDPLTEGLKFDVLFEKRAIAIELEGHFRYQISDKFLWKNQFKYIQFNLIRENDQAWGIIPLELSSNLNWKLNNRLNFDASGQFWTGSKSSSSLGQAFKLNNTFVLNAGMQYYLSKNWTFWAKGENMLDQQYQRWANYPSLGVQLIAGVQYKFGK